VDLFRAWQRDGGFRRSYPSRHRTRGILIAIGWFLIVENLVLGFFPQLGRYMLTGASSAIGNSGNTDLLAWWGGVLVMIGYVGGLGVAAAFTLRRDVK